MALGPVCGRDMRSFGKLVFAALRRSWGSASTPVLSVSWGRRAGMSHESAASISFYQGFRHLCMASQSEMPESPLPAVPRIRTVAQVMC